MTTSLTIDSDKRDIALKYLSICARKVAEARGDYDEAFAQVRALKHYIELAKQYGCTEREMMFALGYNVDQYAHAAKAI
jgi:predicted kinase